MVIKALVSDTWNHSLPLVAAFLAIVAIVLIGAISLCIWGTTWVFTQGPLWSKVGVSIIIFLIVRAAIPFARYFTDDIGIDQEKIPF